MKIKSIRVDELIAKLQKMCPEAKVEVVALNYPQEFEITFGGYDGCTPERCSHVVFYVNMLHRGDGTYIKGQGDEVTREEALK